MIKKHIRVMVVEDNEATAYLIKKAFSDRGEKVDWDICFAKDGQEALDCLFRKGRYAEAALPEFVLLDWNLPKISGKEVLKAAQERPCKWLRPKTCRYGWPVRRH